MKVRLVRWLLLLSAVIATGLVTGPQLPAVAQDQPSLASIMQKYADALGGNEKLAGIKSVESVYTSTLLGRAVTVTTVAKEPAFFLQRVSVKGTPLRLSVGFDGKTAWTKTIQGDVLTLTGSKRADMINQAAGINNSEIFPERWPTQLMLKPTEMVGGRQYYVVSVRPAGGSAHDLLIDAQTYLPVISREYEGDVRTLNVVKDFGKGPLGEMTGVVIVSTRSDGSLPDVTSTLVSTRDNISVDDSIFAPPIPTNAPTTST